MTCLNCPIEITDMHLYQEGVHVTVVYRDSTHRFFYLWSNPTRLGFFTLIDLLKRVVNSVRAYHSLPGIKE